MVKKRTNRVTCGRLHGLRLGGSLIAVLGAIGMLSPSAMAAEQVPADPCNEAVVTEQEAQTLANSFLQEQSWVTWREFRSTAETRFQIGEATCVNGQWQVRVDFSRRIDSLHGRKRVVLINCHSGAIEEKSRSA